MKNKFNFLQIANWVYFCIQNLKSIKNTNLSNEEVKLKLQIEIKKLEIIKDVLNKQKKLQGINSQFLKNLSSIKKDYGIIE